MIQKTLRDPFVLSEEIGSVRIKIFRVCNLTTLYIICGRIHFKKWTLKVLKYTLHKNSHTFEYYIETLNSRMNHQRDRFIRLSCLAIPFPLDSRLH